MISISYDFCIVNAYKHIIIIILSIRCKYDINIVPSIACNYDINII